MTRYNNLFLKYFYPFRRKIGYANFKDWISDATKGIELNGKKILVVACGPGFEIPLFAQKIGIYGFIDASDISEEMLTHAHELSNENNLKNVKIFYGDAQDINNFPVNTYDYVFIILGLPVIPDFIKSIKFSFETLKVGGSIIVFDSQTPTGIRGKFIDLYHKIFGAHNRPIVQELKKYFIQSLYKIYPDKIYFLWRGIKNKL